VLEGKTAVPEDLDAARRSRGGTKRAESTEKGKPYRTRKTERWLNPSCRKTGGDGVLVDDGLDGGRRLVESGGPGKEVCVKESAAPRMRSKDVRAEKKGMKL